MTTTADAKIPAPHPNMLGAEDPVANLDRDQPAAKPSERSIIDGNTAAADVAFRVNELCSIYPITPSSPAARSTWCTTTAPTRCWPPTR